VLFILAQQLLLRLFVVGVGEEGGGTTEGELDPVTPQKNCLTCFVFLLSAHISLREFLTVYYNEFQHVDSSKSDRRRRDLSGVGCWCSWSNV
jgi:hypothetical protein